MAESGEMITRRTFAMAGLGVGLSACGGHNRATGFSGYAFIANQEGGADRGGGLGSARGGASSIRVERGADGGGRESKERAGVYALTPENGIGPRDRRRQSHLFAQAAKWLRRRLEMVAFCRAVTRSIVLCRKPRQLVWLLALDPMRGSGWIPLLLPNDPAGFDLSPDGNSAAVSSGARAARLLSSIWRTGAVFSAMHDG